MPIHSPVDFDRSVVSGHPSRASAGTSGAAITTAKVTPLDEEKAASRATVSLDRDYVSTSSSLAAIRRTVESPGFKRQ